MATSTATSVAGSSAIPTHPCSTTSTALLTTIPPAPTVKNRRTRGSDRRALSGQRSFRAIASERSAAAGAGWYHGRSLAGGMPGPFSG